ncbi:hypothetical protein [Thiomicrorhabdus cannonii]|uniref:hypothetical protein n=1 Tax=Thiomicrorhabdus cannonii TaxID=2748011 RepID=UPI0015BAE97C|nr:hypothetical protein [Thiomicrorhabdus cannonii]
MQTTLRQTFFTLIGTAMLLGSGSLMAHDKPADHQPQHHKPHHHAKMFHGHAHPSHRMHHARHEHRLDRMRVALQLSPGQMMELRVLFKDHQAERKALRHQHIKHLHGVLTPHQRHQWRELRAQRALHHSHRY